MSLALIVTMGFGNGTLEGSIADIVTLGYTIGADPTSPNVITIQDANRGLIIPAAGRTVSINGQRNSIKIGRE